MLLRTCTSKRTKIWYSPKDSGLWSRVSGSARHMSGLSGSWVPQSSNEISCIPLIFSRKPKQKRILAEQRTALMNNSSLFFSHWCGSGSEIRDLVPFWPLDPGSGMGKKSGSGSGMNNLENLNCIRFFSAEIIKIIRQNNAECQRVKWWKKLILLMITSS